MTGCADSEAFRKRLLHEAGIAVLADIHFGRRVPGRRAAHPLLVRGVERGDRAGHRAPRRVRAQGPPLKDFVAHNRASRDAVLERVRRALGKTGADDQARADAQAYV